MLGPGQHGDDADDDLPPSLLPPDDRLWRHPSEVGWATIGSSSFASPGAAAPGTPPALAPSGAAAHPMPRLWAVALVAGVAGAVLTLGAVVLTTDLREEAPQRLADLAPVATARVGLPVSDASAVVQALAPSVVRVERIDATGSASGVVIDSAGVVLTTAHVVAQGDRVRLVRGDGSTIEGRVVGVDPVTDVAVIEAAEREAEWEPAVLGSADALEVGEAAVLVGSAADGDDDPAVALGVVSGMGRQALTGDGRSLHGLIETDEPVPAASAGGALCDGSGAVVGIATAADSPAEAGAMGYAVPIDTARSVAAELLASGVARHVWLGIAGTTLSPTVSTLAAVSTGSGAFVNEVVPGGPAAEAGIVPGDVLVGVDGEPVSSMADLLAVLLWGYEPGDVVEVALERGASTLTVEVTLGERP